MKRRNRRAKRAFLLARLAASVLTIGGAAGCKASATAASAGKAARWSLFGSQRDDDEIEVRGDTTVSKSWIDVVEVCGIVFLCVVAPIATQAMVSTSRMKKEQMAKQGN